MCIRRLQRHVTKLAWAFYALWTVVITWPLSRRLTTALYGSAGDNLGSVWIFWWLRNTREQGLPWQHVPLVAAPFGWSLGSVPLQYPPVFVAVALSTLIGEVAVYNLSILVSFWLSAVAMYLLVHHITHSRAGGFIAGLIYAFAPYHSAHAQAHLHLAATEWMPLCLLALLRLDEKRSWRSGALWGVALAVVVLNSYYYGYFMAFIVTAFLLTRLLWELLAHRRWPFDRRYMFALLAGGLVCLVLVSPALYAIMRQAGSQGSADGGQVTEYDRPISDVHKFAASPWNYVLPSTDHPVFGRYVASFADAHPPYKFDEHNLFLGYVAMALAMVAFVGWRIPGQQQWSGKQGPLQTAMPFTLVVLTALAVLALVLSAPPTIPLLSATVPMPSGFLHRLLPMFRVYARFGVIVLLAISALAGMGLAVIRRLLPGDWRYTMLVALVGGLVLFEFAGPAPAPLLDLGAVPDVYIWLAEQPDDFTIVEYPLVHNNDRLHYRYLYYQTLHGKRLFNGTPKGTPEDQLRAALADPSDTDTLRLLAHLNVRYVIVHRDLFTAPIPHVFSAKDSGLVLIAQFKDTHVYKVQPGPTPEVYTWLAERPGDFAIIEYPLEPSRGLLYYRYLAYQPIHAKRQLNRELRQAWPTALRKGLTDLAGSDTAAMLAHLGVRYVVIHRASEAECHLPEQVAPALLPVAAFPDAQVYEVRAAPPASRVLALPNLGVCGWTDGFYPMVDGRDDSVQYHMDTIAHVTLFNPSQEEARISLRASIEAFEENKTLQVFLDNALLRQLTLNDGTETALDLDYLVVPPGLSDLELIVVEGGQVALRDLKVLPNPLVYDPPDAAHTLAAGFGNQMALVGYDLAETSLRPGDTVHVQLYWRAVTTMERDYTVSVQLMGEDGPIAQTDRQPLHGLYPTSRWRTGEVVEDSYALVLPPEVPPNEYSLILLVYDLATMERLQLTSEGHTDTWVELARLPIQSH